MTERSISRTHLVILLVAALAIRIVRLNSSGLWLDEFTSIQIATKSIADILGGVGFDSHTPPLYYLLLHGWFRLFDPNEISLRLFSVFFDLANVVLITILSAREFGSKIGFQTGLLYTLSGYAIYYAQEGRMYSLLLFFALVIFFLMSGIAKRKASGFEVIALGVVSALALYTHYYSGLFLASLCAAMFLEFRSDWKILRPLIISMLLGALLYLPFVGTVIRLAGSGGQAFRHFNLNVVPFTLFRFSAGYAIAPLNAPTRYHMSQYLAENWWLVFLFIFVFGYFAAKGLTVFLRSSDRKWLWASAMILPGVLALIISLKAPLFSERYLIISFPFFLQAVVLGINSLNGRFDEGMRIALASLVLLQVTGHAWNPRFGREQWREVAEYIDQSGDPVHDEVRVSPVYCSELLDFYLRGNFRIAQSPSAPYHAADSGERKHFWLVQRGTDYLPHTPDLVVHSTKTFPLESGILVEEFSAN